MSQRIERAVFLVHGVVTLAAAIVLVAFPAAIPATVGIVVDPAESLLLYFLAAAELAIATLSIGTARLRDQGAIRLIAGSFAVFHGATAALEIVYLVMQGASPALIANIVVRIIATAVFVFIARRSR